MTFAALIFSAALLAQGESVARESFVLENGLRVVFCPRAPAQADGATVPFHFCFPSGYALQPFPGAVATCLAEIVDDGGEEKSGPSIKDWVDDEACGLTIWLTPSEVESALRRLGDRFWEDAPKVGLLRYECEGSPMPENRRFSKDDFLAAMLKRSGYATLSSSRSVKLKEFPESLKGFRANLLHPRQTLLLVEAQRSPSLEAQIRKALDRPHAAPLSLSFSVVEETPYLAEKSKALFAAVEKPRLAVVFSAPTRGSADMQAFSLLAREARERFGSDRVTVWSGLGTGLFWIEYETSVERYPVVATGFLTAIHSFREEMVLAYQPHEPLLGQHPDEEGLDLARRLAARHFWGVGYEDLENPQADAVEIHDAASRYLRRPAFFILWPESRKDDWKGFP